MMGEESGGTKTKFFFLFFFFRDESRPKERSLTKEATLKIQMSSVRYVHTKRFIAEIQQFFHEFSQLQTVSSFI